LRFHQPTLVSWLRYAAAIEYGVKISGCTIHFVDNQYDHGPVIMQRAVPVLDDDTPESLAARVFAAECEAYPEAIALIAAGRVAVQGRLVRVLAASGEGEQKANRPVR